MDIKQLECFIHLAETLSFSATAQIMYLSQPAVSGQIRSLENELEVRLFERTKRSVSLTTAGKSYYNDIKSILESLNQAKTKAKYHAKRYSQKYIIAYEDNFLAVNYLSKIIHKFREIHPEVFLELKVTPHHLKNQLYLENKINFMFTVYDGLDKLPDIAYKELYISHFVCVMPQNHVLSASPSISLETMVKYDLILLNPTNAPEEMRRMLHKIDEISDASSKLYCDSVFSGYTLVKSGYGIAIMPDFVCLECPDVTAVSIASNDYVSYGIAWNKNTSDNIAHDLINVAENIYPKLSALNDIPAGPFA